MSRFKLWAPVIAYMAVLYFLSSRSTLPASDMTPDWTQHGLAYAGLALVALRAFSGARWAGVGGWTVAAAWVLATGYGVTDEWHQLFVPERMADLRDVMADAAGAALALGAAWAWSIIRRSS